MGVRHLGGEVKREGAAAASEMTGLSHSGANSDVFRIFFCVTAPGLPANFNGSSAPAGCTGPEGNTLRTGNIQVRQTITGGSASVLTAARAPLRLP